MHRTAASLSDWCRRRFASLIPVFRDFDLRVTVTLLAATVLLLVYRRYGQSAGLSSVFDVSNLRGGRYFSVYGNMYRALSCFLLLGLAPVLLSLVPRLRPPDLGLGLGDWRFGLKMVVALYLVMLPLVLIVSQTPSFYNYYPMNGVIRGDVFRYLTTGATPDGFFLAWVAHELCHPLYFMGWEYFFHAYLMFGLHARYGFTAVLIGTVPFALLHTGKPFPEALGSIVAGVVLGIFAIRARSYWYCWAVHVLVALTMDFAAIIGRFLHTR